jgi:hypothetical protein
MCRCAEDNQRKYCYISIIKISCTMDTNLGSDLIMHGIEVFGTKEKFAAWLEKENFFFDKKAPMQFTNTDAGIKFINDRLTGMQYGDNV